MEYQTATLGALHLIEAHRLARDPDGRRYLLQIERLGFNYTDGCVYESIADAATECGAGHRKTCLPRPGERTLACSSSNQSESIMSSATRRGVRTTLEA